VVDSAAASVVSVALDSVAVESVAVESVAVDPVAAVTVVATVSAAVPEVVVTAAVDGADVSFDLDSPPQDAASSAAVIAVAPMTRER
jgi:hypothetical protein